MAFSLDLRCGLRFVTIWNRMSNQIPLESHTFKSNLLAGKYQHHRRWFNHDIYDVYWITNLELFTSAIFLWRGFLTSQLIGTGNYANNSVNKDYRDYACNDKPDDCIIAICRRPITDIHVECVIISAKRLCFCYRVFDCEQDNSKSCERILMTFFGGVGCVTGNSLLDFGSENKEKKSESYPNPRCSDRARAIRREGMAHIRL